jgi:hypothetical protein
MSIFRETMPAKAPRQGPAYGSLTGPKGPMNSLSGQKDDPRVADVSVKHAPNATPRGDRK